MLISYILSGCTDCNSLDTASCNLDAVLANYGKNAWQNISYMTNKPLPRNGVKRIMYYQEIINNLKWDQCFYSPFQFPDIVSRAGVIADGFVGIVKRRTLPTYTTTTTTSTTTTSTTSTTTSTTTTTTSSTTTTTTTT